MGSTLESVFMKMFPHILYRALVLGLALGAMTPARAASVTWDGNGDANASGNWQDGANWSSDAIPGAADNARLLDVTTGTRTVTIGTAQTINQLTITQSTVGASNVLNVDANLTLTSTATTYSPFAITASAGASSIVTNIADGISLLVQFSGTNTGNSVTANYGGTVNLGVGSTFIISKRTSENSAVATFSGPVNLESDAVLGVQNSATNQSAALTLSDSINLGDGAVLLAQTAGNKTGTVNLNGDLISAGGKIHSFGGTSGILNLNADVELSDGEIKVTGSSAVLTVGAAAVVDLDSSTALLQFSGAQGDVALTINGTLNLNSTAMTLDWSATSSNSGSRRYNNTGTLILENNSALSFTSSGGREIGNEGNGSGKNNASSGTIRVESGSRLEFMGLTNTGNFYAGSSTAGGSDALVRLGSSLGTTNSTGFRTVIFNNGYTTGNATMEILGDVFLGTLVAGSGTYTSLENGTGLVIGSGSSATNASTGSVIQIGSATQNVVFTVGNPANVRVTNASDNLINLAQGSTFLLKSSATGNNAGIIDFGNRGTFEHGGKLQIQGNFSAVRTFNHAAGSIYRIDGTNAILEALPGNGSGSNIADITFSVGGLLVGKSSNDKLTYVNSTGNSSRNALTASISGGEIAPGNGTAGSGTSSVGKLELANINVTTSGAAKLSIDVGGTSASGLFDQISLTGTSGRIFTLAGTNDTLDIHIVNGFTTDAPQTYLILTSTNASGRVGTFDTLLYNGAVVTDQYTVNYLANGIEVTFTSIIPEPSTAALLVLGGLGLLARARRA